VACWRRPDLGKHKYSKTLQKQGSGGRSDVGGGWSEENARITQFFPAEVSPQDKVDASKKVSRKLMNKLGGRIDPYLNDHGSGHVERVSDNLDLIRDSMEDSGLTQEELGHPHTEEEAAAQDVAAQLHDVGRAMPIPGYSHAVASSELVRKDREVPLTNWERERVARFVALHSQKASQELFGTSNLPELARRGALSREEAYLAGELRVADALDIGVKRVERNTQGEPMETAVKRLRSDPRLSKEVVNARLSHIYGHQAIKDWRMQKREGKPMITFNLDSSQLDDKGADAAYRIKDTLKDLNSTFLKGRFHVGFVSSDSESVQNWYKKYGYIMSEDVKETRVYIGRSA